MALAPLGGVAATMNGVAWVVAEHWTDSRASVVLAGSHGMVCRMADRIGLARGEVVRVTPARSALALHGSALERYLTRVAQLAPANDDDLLDRTWIAPPDPRRR